MSKRHKPEEIVAKLRQVDVLTSQGQTVVDAVRAIGVTEVTYYRWRQEYGGLKSGQVRRMKELELENQRLRKAVADLTLDKQILAEAAWGVKGVPDTVRWTVSALNGRSP
jgi:putative transposase